MYLTVVVCECIFEKKTMTRINVAIKPAELPSKLLLAELREIKRIPNVISRGKYVMDGIPTEFTLGKGHVKFFYNKMQYLLDRYTALFLEARIRNYDVTDFSSAWDNVPKELMNGYDERAKDREIIINRIQERGFFINK
jgi:deoxyribonuclease (pyrimidine dimer)